MELLFYNTVLLDAVGGDYTLILCDKEQVRLYLENPKFRARRKRIAVLEGGSINEAREAARGELKPAHPTLWYHC